MRIYVDNKKEEIFTVICNHCNKEIKVENNIIKEGVFTVNYLFSYFSNKDGERHSFDLCEECYDKMIQGFKVPPEVKEEVEIL